MNLRDMRPNACRAANFLKSLANEHRLMILCSLIEGEKSVGDLLEELKVRQPHLSQQLSRLRLCGLVELRREAQTIFYSLTNEAVTEVIEVLYRQFCKPKPRQRTRQAAAARAVARPGPGQPTLTPPGSPQGATGFAGKTDSGLIRLHHQVSMQFGTPASRHPEDGRSRISAHAPDDEAENPAIAAGTDSSSLPVVRQNASKSFTAPGSVARTSSVAPLAKVPSALRARRIGNGQLTLWHPALGRPCNSPPSVHSDVEIYFGCHRGLDISRRAAQRRPVDHVFWFVIEQIHRHLAGDHFHVRFDGGDPQFFYLATPFFAIRLFIIVVAMESTPGITETILGIFMCMPMTGISIAGLPSVEMLRSSFSSGATGRKR